MEISIRRVLSHPTALGPYSRFGWHHPGAFLFYLFAPLYKLSRGNSRALFVNTWLLNAGCALTVVAIVRRFAGEAVALASAVILALFLGATGFGPLINPWNPYVLAMPVLLTLVAGAGAATGSVGALVTAGLAGSFAVQTHIGTAPAVATALLAATLACVLARRGTTRSSRGGWRDPSRWATAAGLLALVVVWIGPVVQELFGHTGNLTLIARFYRHPPADAGVTHHHLSEALGAGTAYPSIVPFGAPANLNGHRGRILVAAVYGLIGLAVGVAGWRRARFAAWLGLASSAALLIAVASASRVIGPLLPYLFLWTSMLGVPALLGALVIVAGMLRPSPQTRDRKALGPTAARVVPALAGAAAALLLTRVALRGALVYYADSPDEKALARAVEERIGPASAAPFRITVRAGQYEDGAVLLTLVKDGYHFVLAAPMNLYAGNASTSHGPVLSLQPSAGDPPAGGRLVASDKSVAVYQLP